MLEMCWHSPRQERSLLKSLLRPRGDLRSPKGSSHLLAWNSLNGLFSTGRLGVEFPPNPMIVSLVVMLKGIYLFPMQFPFVVPWRNFTLNLTPASQNSQLNTYRFDQDVRPELPQVSHGLPTHRTTSSNQLSCVVDKYQFSKGYLRISSSRS